jgi:hypothetical protein
MINLFEDIKITKGYNRSILLDLTKNDFELIDNELIQILKDISKHDNFEAIIKKHPNFKDELNLLNSKNYFNTEYNPVLFPEINTLIENGFHFQSITLEVSEITLSFIEDYFELLIHLTQNIYLIINKFDNKLINVLNNSFDGKNNHVRVIFCSDSKNIELFQNENSNFNFITDYYEFNFSQEKNSYNKNWTSLICNWFVYFENINYNSGFFEKLYIHKNGKIGINHLDDLNLNDIKNVKNIDDLIKIKEESDYKELVSIKNDFILICKDCEFRHICVDIKTPKKNNENLYFKSECNYNPYISKWEGEEGYKTLAECGVLSNENGFSIDHDKIAEINKVLWGE